MSPSDSKSQPHYGPGNPHPLSQVKTELIWEGKYDEHGNRREVDVAGCVLPLQRVESIDEPRSHAEGAGQMEMFKKQSKRQDDFRNQLIWGDNKLVMASLLAEFKGKIDLIYIDPPFDVGADFTMEVPIGGEKDTAAKEQSALEMVVYRDMWGKGTDSYVHMLYERLVVMKDLLNEEGSIFVHVDYRVSGFVRCLLDDVFGAEQFINEIIWQKCNTKNYTTASLSNLHDTIFFYSKGRGYKFNEVFEKLKPEYIETAYRYVDDKGKRYRLLPLHAPGRSNGATGDAWKGMLPLEGNHWRFHPDTLTEMDSKGLIEVSKTGVPAYRKYLDDSEGVRIGTIWLDAKQLPDSEKVDYPTQKPSSVIERVLRIGSNPEDLVADFFCGSGTTAAVAEKLGRRWIMADLGRFAIHTTRKRLIEAQRERYDANEPYRPFDVYNLGRYERQWWQKERLAGMEEEHQKIVLAFYRAEPLTGASSALLHGRKGPALVHVDGIDSILTQTELKPIVEAAHAAGAKEIHCLAWEFEMELKRNVEALEHEHAVRIRLVRIPREVMERNRRPGVDNVPFFEMATLTAEPVIKIEGGVRVVDVKLTSFLPSLSEVSSKELEALKERAIKSGFDFIDFWAVDFDHKDGQPFKHHWQDYRLRKDRSLKLQSDCGHRYRDNPAGAGHKICVKVIDTFGCDTSILLDLPGTLRQGSGQALRCDSGQALRRDSGQALRRDSGQARGKK